MAILIYYILSCHFTFLPYTAIVFLLGFGMGYVHYDEHPDDSTIQKSAKCYGWE